MLVSIEMPDQVAPSRDARLAGQVTSKQWFAEKQQPRQRVGVIVVKA
jgi:hypothetical protein